MRKVVETGRAPAAIGPYSQAVDTGNFIFISGQIPVNPSTGAVVDGGIEEQTAMALENLKNVLEAAGSSIAGVVKTTVYIRDMRNFTEMNRVYEKYFTAPYPARSCVEAAGLPKNVLVEIEAIAQKCKE